MSDWVSEYGVKPPFCTNPDHEATIAELRSQLDEARTEIRKCEQQHDARVSDLQTVRSQLEALHRSATQIEDLKTKLEETRSQAEKLEEQLEAAQLEAAQWASAEGFCCRNG